MASSLSPADVLDAFEWLRLWSRPLCTYVQTLYAYPLVRVKLFKSVQLIVHWENHPGSHSIACVCVCVFPCSTTPPPPRHLPVPQSYISLNLTLAVKYNITVTQLLMSHAALLPATYCWGDGTCCWGMVEEWENTSHGDMLQITYMNRPPHWSNCFTFVVN